MHMRRYWYLVVAGATASLLAGLTASPAFADNGVLTFGGAGGTNVAVGDVLSANLSSASADFLQSATGTTGITCTTSSFTATVTANPAAPGTATESLTAQSFSGCTSNIPFTNGVQSVTLQNLPYSATVSDGSGAPVTIGESSSTAPLQTTIVVSSIFGAVTCVFQATSITGTANPADNSIDFSSQPFTKSSGPGTCGSQGFFSASYGPVLDTSQAGSPQVFVN